MMEALQNDAAKQKSEDARSMEMHRICRKAEKVWLSRHRRLESEEQQTYINLQKEKEARAKRLAEVEQDQKLAQAMAELKRQDILRIKNNQLRQNNCHELRRVEKQLRTAYLKKELLCQIKEKECLKKEVKAKTYYDDLKIIEAVKKEETLEMETFARIKEQKSEYKKAITEQIRENAERRQDELLSRRPVEFESTDNVCVSKNDLDTDRVFRKELDEFRKIKNEIKENERKEAEKTDKRIDDYLKYVENRTEQYEKIKNKKKQDKEKVYAYLFDNLIENLSLNSNVSGKNEMIEALEQERQQNAFWLAEKKERELKKIQQGETLKRNKEQLMMKKDKDMAEREKDLAEVKKLLNNSREFDEAEKKKNCDRRQKMIEYGRELKNSIDLREELRKKQKTQMKNESSEVSRLEKLRMAEIEKEQKLLVEPHMENLKEFFPPSCAVEPAQQNA